MPFILSRVKKSRTISLCPTKDVTHPVVQPHILLVTQPGYRVWIICPGITGYQGTLIVHHNGPKVQEK